MFFFQSSGEIYHVNTFIKVKLYLKHFYLACSYSSAKSINRHREKPLICCSK